MWESLSEPEKASWLDKASTTYDWVVWCKSKKGAEEVHSFELSRKEIFSNYDKTESKKVKRKRECTIQVMMEARQHQNGSEGGSRFMLGSHRSFFHDKINSGVVDSS